METLSATNRKQKHRKHMFVADLSTNSAQTAEELESRNKLLRLLDSVIDALVWAISKLGLSTQQQTLRLGHLTMLLSHIRHVRYTLTPTMSGTLTSTMAGTLLSGTL